MLSCDDIFSEEEVSASHQKRRKRRKSRDVRPVLRDYKGVLVVISRGCQQSEEVRLRICGH